MAEMMLLLVLEEENRNPKQLVADQGLVQRMF